MYKVDLQLFAEDDDDEEIEENPLQSLEDFVNEEDEPDEEEPAEDSEIEIEEEKEEKPVKKAPVNTQPSKEEHAWGKVKKQNAYLQTENTQLKGLVDAMEKRLAALENTETERGFENKKTVLVQKYVDEGWDENYAAKLAANDIETEKLRSELSSIKKQLEGGESKAELKTKTEQTILYNMQKAQKAKVELANSKSPESSLKLTSEQKRVWDMTKKTAWGKSMTLKDFLANWDE